MKLDNYFNSSQKTAERLIKSGSNTDLVLARFAAKVLSESKVELPYLDKKETNIRIGEAVVEPNKLPNGEEHIPGQIYEFAEIRVPIKGRFDLFEELCRLAIANNRHFYIDSYALVYKEFSTEKIVGNDQEINRIKLKAKKAYDQIDSVIGEADRTTENFHIKTLQPFIQEMIDTERTRRNQNDDSVAKLNPFS